MHKCKTMKHEEMVVRGWHHFMSLFLHQPRAQASNPFPPFCLRASRITPLVFESGHTLSLFYLYPS